MIPIFRFDSIAKDGKIGDLWVNTNLIATAVRAVEGGILIYFTLFEKQTQCVHVTDDSWKTFLAGEKSHE